MNPDKERYDFYKEHGICTSCGHVWSEPGHVYCKECFKKRKARQNKERNRDNMREKRATRRSLNLCVECGGETDGIHFRCEKCLSKNRERMKLYNIRKRIKRNVCNESPVLKL